MPKYTPQNKKKKDLEFLTALKETGSAKEAAKLVGNIGSQGGKDLEHIAEAMGTKRLKQVESSILEAAYSEGVNPKKIARKINKLLDEENPTAIDKGITQALKIGVGGGYVPEKKAILTKKIVTNEKSKELVDEFDERFKQTLLDE